MYRKGVSAIIINDNKEFLLVNLESFETRFFAIPGGALDEGETQEEAVYREIKEELGIKKKSLELIGESKTTLRFKFKTIKLSRDGIEYEGSERHFFGFKFTGNNEEITLPDGDIRSYRWTPFAELKDYLLFDNQLEETSEKILEIFSIS